MPPKLLEASRAFEALPVSEQRQVLERVAARCTDLLERARSRIPSEDFDALAPAGLKLCDRIMRMAALLVEGAEPLPATAIRDLARDNRGVAHLEPLALSGEMPKAGEFHPVYRS